MSVMICCCCCCPFPLSLSQVLAEVLDDLPLSGDLSQSNFDVKGAVKAYPPLISSRFDEVLAMRQSSLSSSLLQTDPSLDWVCRDNGVSAAANLLTSDIARQLIEPGHGPAADSEQDNDNDNDNRNQNENDDTKMIREMVAVYGYDHVIREALAGRVACMKFKDMQSHLKDDL